jgi:hypothetical protein
MFASLAVIFTLNTDVPELFEFGVKMLHQHLVVWASRIADIFIAKVKLATIAYQVH